VRVFFFFFFFSYLFVRIGTALRWEGLVFSFRFVFWR